LDPVEPQLVLGTAGHIDHGKTALIRALTGVDTDRLPEEKARGITIDLGFAPLELPGGRHLSVVDVPGHEGLVRTMVSGATGIDLVLLVVAADEGVMPQTREHVAICELLGIDRGVVALTKMDSVDEEMAELAAEDVSDLLASTPLATAPLIPVSAVSGVGLDDLREALLGVIDGAPPRTPRNGPPRLAIDRTFAARGFGCVVTGTLVGGRFSVGDAVEILPGGLEARVRGLQSHGVSQKERHAGTRCAVNLQGIELADVSRGQVVTTPHCVVPTTTADVRIAWLEVAPDIDGQAAVEFLSGTSERRARIAPIGSDRLASGEVRFARVHIDGDPVPILPGDRFIVRGFARTDMGGSTLGGGVVLDVAPPHRRRSDPGLVSDLEILARRDPRSDLTVRIARSGFTGVSRDVLRCETGLDPADLDSLLAKIADDDEAAATTARTWLTRPVLDQLAQRLVSALDAYHEAEPLRPGMPTGTLRGRLPENVGRDAAELVIERMVASGSVRIEGDVALRPSHRPKLDAKDEAIVAKLVAEASAAGLEPPAPREWAERLDVTPERFRDLVAHLERGGTLVHAPGDLWFDAAAVSDLRDRVTAHLREHGTLDTQTYKGLIGTTRRTAVPLMELFDEEHLTARRGDARVLRGGS
jgi:selenocysteine-specific elongation factor